jgi:hypothetical protein
MDISSGHDFEKFHAHWECAYSILYDRSPPYMDVVVSVEPKKVEFLVNQFPRKSEKNPKSDLITANGLVKDLFHSVLVNVDSSAEATDLFVFNQEGVCMIEI